MIRFVALPILAAVCSSALLAVAANAENHAAKSATKPSTFSEQPITSFTAQVVGLQWLNPLQRRDYPTEWQLLWTMGLVTPNINDDMVRSKPRKYVALQAFDSIVSADNETFEGFHQKYVEALTDPIHDIYFSSSRYFYNAHSLKDKSTWRELAGIRIQHTLPEQKIDSKTAEAITSTTLTKTFAIGNPNFPTAWTRDTPPDVRVTAGGPNAGFTSLSAALDYLQKHPTETVWAMSWDAPNFPPKADQLNENMTLLVLAGPNYKTERNALAWIGYPATRDITSFEEKNGLPPAQIQAWSAAIDAAAKGAGKEAIDIGYAIHDANTSHAQSPDRIGDLAQTLTMAAPGFDFNKQNFNTPALLGDMGAGSALTNIALGIAYANHLGKNVLVAGTTDRSRPTAVLVIPPEKPRPINPEADWFRARSEATAYLMWWGLRHDAQSYMQGYSE
jgi:hypothetical protein